MERCRLPEWEQGNHGCIRALGRPFPIRLLMIDPDVRKSAAPLQDHTAKNFSEQRSVLAQELADTGDVQNDRCCPINGPFLALLDSHEKTG